MEVKWQGERRCRGEAEGMVRRRRRELKEEKLDDEGGRRRGRVVGSGSAGVEAEVTRELQVQDRAGQAQDPKARDKDASAHLSAHQT